MSSETGSPENSPVPGMDAEPGPDLPVDANDKSLSWYSAREPVVILVLSAIAIAFFFLVSGLSGLYTRELNNRATLLANRGENDLRAGKFAEAATDFQSALTYSRGNYAYELSLAQALVELNRIEEARTYLINLWQRQPENGSVNLELARIFAEKGDITGALRYYHNAIYSVWSGNSEVQQLAVRLELVNFLLEHKADNLAESELIAVGRNLPEDASLRIHIGDLFMRVPDYGRALTMYQQALSLEHRNAEALGKAGQAAFELGQYKLAKRYLTSSLGIDPDNDHNVELLKMCRAIPNLDPYNFYSEPQRTHVVLSDFEIAGRRLNACINAPPNGKDSAAALLTLQSRWLDMKGHLNQRTLRQDPRMTDSAMDLVFDIERQTSIYCGAPAGNDSLLLLIARNREGS